jgi:hypothetical protein
MNKYLFYYEEAVSAWIPAPEKISDIIDKDSHDDVGEKFELEFKIVEMTEDEYNNLPEV